MAVGTLFTLFVVPSIYMLIARDHSRETAVDAVSADNVCRAPWTETFTVPAGCRLEADQDCNWSVDCGNGPAPEPQWRQAS
jgi:hypothetical protein